MSQQQQQQYPPNFPQFPRVMQQGVYTKNWFIYERKSCFFSILINKILSKKNIRKEPTTRTALPKLWLLRPDSGQTWCSCRRATRKRLLITRTPIITDAWERLVICLACPTRKNLTACLFLHWEIDFFTVLYGFNTVVILKKFAMTKAHIFFSENDFSKKIFFQINTQE